MGAIEKSRPLGRLFFVFCTSTRQRGESRRIYHLPHGGGPAAARPARSSRGIWSCPCGSWWPLGRGEQPTRPLSPWRWLVAGRAARSGQGNMKLPMWELGGRQGRGEQTDVPSPGGGRQPSGRPGVSGE